MFSWAIGENQRSIKKNKPGASQQYHNGHGIGHRCLSDWLPRPFPTYTALSMGFWIFGSCVSVTTLGFLGHSWQAQIFFSRNEELWIPENENCSLLNNVNISMIKMRITTFFANVLTLSEWSPCYSPVCCQ